MNRVIKTFKFLFIINLFCVFTFSASSKEKLKLTHIDRKEYSLHKGARGGNNNYSSYFGIYRHPLASKGGRFLYLFPDNSFSIAHFCDICPERKLLGYGTYEFKNSKIIFNYKLKPTEAPDFSNVFWGWIEKEDYVTGDLKILVSDKSLLKIKNKDRTMDYLVQIDKYHEWRKTKNKLENQIKKSKLETN